MKRRLIIPVVMVLLVAILNGCSDEVPNRIDEVFYLRHKGADMPVHVHGTTEANTYILILHGAGSFGLAFRDGVFSEILEEKYVMVYWDQRGQSMSQGRYNQPDTPEGVIDLMTEDVIMLTRLLKERYGEDINLYLMGHSWGGLLGMNVLLREGMQSEYNGWISIAGAHNMPLAASSRKPLMLEIANEHIGFGILVEEWEALKAEVETLDAESDEDYDRTLELAMETIRLLYASGTVDKPVSNEKLYRTILDNNPVSWQVSNFFNRPVESALEIDYQVTTEQLGTFTIPTFMMYGKYDVSVPPAVGYNAFVFMRRADRQVVLMNYSIHHPFDTQGEEAADYLIEFVDKYN